MVLSLSAEQPRPLFSDFPVAYLVQYFVVSRVALELENYFWIQFQIQKQQEDMIRFYWVTHFVPLCFLPTGPSVLAYHEGCATDLGSKTFSGTTSHQHVTWYEHATQETTRITVSHWFSFLTKIIDASRILLAQRVGLSSEVNNIYKTTGATLKITPKWRGDLQNVCLGGGTRLADWSNRWQIQSVSVAVRIELPNTIVLTI